MTRDEMMAAINDALYRDTQAGHMLPWREVAALGDALHRRLAALSTPAPVGEAERQDCIPCVTATWCDLAGRCLAECSPGDDDAPLRAVYEPPAALE